MQFYVGMFIGVNIGLFIAAGMAVAKRVDKDL